MATPKDSGEKDRLIGHEYDGIQEYDNPMPRWWLLTFAGTVIYSVIYLFNVGPIGNGKGRIADYEESLQAHAALLASAPQSGAPLTDSAIAAFVADIDIRARGREVYASYCASCHAADGGGMIGPNLVDDYYIHGARPADIYRVVEDGVLDKGMPPWGKSLKPEQLRGVVAYIVSLRGTVPANPKAPQGELVAK
jgi:cytochrome c oxidase cbb3-type subunit III